MIALDTNLLVYAHRAGTSEHGAARASIERAAQDRRGCGLSLFCIAEFWSIVTHPNLPSASPAAEAHAFLHTLIESADLTVWSPDGTFTDRLTSTAHKLGVRGARIFDLQIALLAREMGAVELWTYDANFVKLDGLRVVKPRV